LVGQLPRVGVTGVLLREVVLHGLFGPPRIHGVVVDELFVVVFVPFLAGLETLVDLPVPFILRHRVPPLHHKLGIPRTIEDVLFPPLLLTALDLLRGKAGVVLDRRLRLLSVQIHMLLLPLLLVQVDDAVDLGGRDGLSPEGSFEEVNVLDYVFFLLLLAEVPCLMIVLVLDIIRVADAVDDCLLLLLGALPDVVPDVVVALELLVEVRSLYEQCLPSHRHASGSGGVVADGGSVFLPHHVANPQDDHPLRVLPLILVDGEGRARVFLLPVLGPQI